MKRRDGVADVASWPLVAELSVLLHKFSSSTEVEPTSTAACGSPTAVKMMVDRRGVNQ